MLNKWQFSRQMHNGIWEWQARKQFAQDRRRLSALASIHEDAAATFENGKDRTEVENASSTLGADSIEAILMSSDSSDSMVCLDSEKEANTGPDKNQQVHSDDEPTTIRVKGLDDTIMNLQVSPNIAIGIALKHYATISELDYSKLEFSFHNMLLRSQQTPHLLGMRDGDVIVCQLGPDRNLLRKPAPGIGAMPAVPADEVSLSAFDLPLPRADLTAAASEEEITRTTVQQVNGETNRVHVDVTDGAQVADSLVSVSAVRNMPWSQKQAAANQDSTGPEMCVEEESATEPVQVSMEEAGDKPVDCSSGALSQNADTGTSGTSISVPRAGELTGDCAGEDMAESRINGQDSAMSSSDTIASAESPETSPGPGAQADVSRPPSRPPPSPPRAKSVEAKGATLPQQDGAGASSSWGQDKMIIVTKETEGKERKAAKVMKQVSDMGRQVFARMGSIKMGVRGQADRGAGRETGAHKN